jgi:hypothetical protein
VSILDLPARVGELERLVAELAERPEPDGGGGSGLQGNVLTLAADGTIGADFTGHVAARGIDFDAADGSGTVPPLEPEVEAVRWLRRADRALVAQVFGGGLGAPGEPNVALVRGRADTPARDAEARIEVWDESGETPAAWLAASTGPSGVTTGARAGGRHKTIFGAGGVSGFLQTDVDQELALQCGRATVPWTGGAGPGGQVGVTVPHNLGRVPRAVLCTPRYDTGWYRVHPAEPFSAANFGVRVWTEQGLGVGVVTAFYWAAIG